MLRRKNKKHSIEIKLKAIELYQAGYGCTKISKKLSISDSLVEHWLRLYRSQGSKCFIKRPNVKASYEFKISIVKEVLEKSLSYETVAIENHLSISAVYSWVQKAKRYGYSSLEEIQPRGRPPKTMGRPKKIEPEVKTDIEKLRAEVEYLKAENAYLKKLRALVEERITRESGKKSKPSSL